MGFGGKADQENVELNMKKEFNVKNLTYRRRRKLGKMYAYTYINVYIAKLQISWHI